MNGRLGKPLFFASKATTIAMLLFVGLQLSSAEQLNSYGEKLTVLKVRNEIYSNVVVTLVTATDIYFTHSRGMGNAKLEDLGPELQSKFHFNAKKALEKENEQRQANVRFDSWISHQTNNRLSGIESAPVISIEVADPAVEYKYYSTRTQLDKPDHIPEGMTGDSHCTFTCDTEFDVRPAHGTNGQPLAFRFQTIKLSIGLPMTLTLPVGATQKLKEHEEGHRHINEYFYSFGRKAAERAIQVALTNQIKSDVKDSDLAESNFVSRVKMLVEYEYWTYTRFPSRPANVYYDELTDHGGNNVDSAEAAEKAIQRYAVQIPDQSADATFP